MLSVNGINVEAVGKRLFFELVKAAPLPLELGLVCPCTRPQVGDEPALRWAATCDDAGAGNGAHAASAGLERTDILGRIVASRSPPPAPPEWMSADVWARILDARRPPSPSPSPRSTHPPPAAQHGATAQDGSHACASSQRADDCRSIVRPEHLDEVLEFTYEELHVASCGFADILGTGGFGIVYRATFAPTTAGRPACGECAAKVVKEFELDSDGSALTPKWHADFLKEIELLRLCKHPNLVTLVGYSLDPRAPALVLPLMVGNLDEFLAIDEAEASSSSSRHADAERTRLQRPGLSRHAPLGWRERLHVIVDAVRGLLYLHTPSRTKPVLLQCVNRV